MSATASSIRYVPPAAREKARLAPPRSEHVNLSRVLHVTTQTMSDERVEMMINELVIKARDIIRKNYDVKFDGPITYLVNVIKRGFHGESVLTPMGFAYVWIDDPNIFNILAGPDVDKFGVETPRRIVKKVYGKEADRNFSSLSWADLIEEEEEYNSAPVANADVLNSTETVDIDHNLLGVVDALLTDDEMKSYEMHVKAGDIDPRRLGKFVENAKNIFMISPHPAPVKKEVNESLDDSSLISRGDLPEWFSTDELAKILARYSTQSVRNYRDEFGNFIQIPVEINRVTVKERRRDGEIIEKNKIIVHYKDGSGDGLSALTMARIVHLFKTINGITLHGTIVFDKALKRRPQTSSQGRSYQSRGPSDRQSSYSPDRPSRSPSALTQQSSSSPRPGSPGYSSAERPNSRPSSVSSRPTSPLVATSPSATPATPIQPSSTPISLRPPAWSGSKPGSIFNK